MMILLLNTLLTFGLAQAGENQTCEAAFNKAMMHCSSHEHAVNAKALSIVSGNTRMRVIKNEEDKLHQLKLSCRKSQRLCTQACESELEVASIEGDDISLPLDRLNDCRQGDIPKQLQAMDRKIIELRKMNVVKRNMNLGKNLRKTAQRGLATSKK